MEISAVNMHLEWDRTTESRSPSQRKSRERALLYHKLCRFHSLMERFTITHLMDVNARGGIHL